MAAGSIVSEMILEINSLTVKYGKFIAVNDLSMSVRRGTVTAVLGANGSGKTSLMNTIAGLCVPFSGSIVFEGEDITGMSADKLSGRGISLVPQGGRCFDRMSVLDNLMVGSYGKNARSRTNKSLEKVYELFPMLYEKRKSPTGSLSGGQRQMTAIGRALMSCPTLMIFDELSLGLAPTVIKDIYAAIKQIGREDGTTIIIAEQDTARAMQMSDYTYIMLKGSIAFEGNSDELSEDTVKKAYFGTWRGDD